MGIVKTLEEGWEKEWKLEGKRTKNKEDTEGKTIMTWLNQILSCVFRH